MYSDFARARVFVLIQQFDTCTSTSIYRGVSFRNRTVYLLLHGRNMIAPPNPALCPEDTPRDIRRCLVTPLTHYKQLIEDSDMTMRPVVPPRGCSVF